MKLIKSKKSPNHFKGRGGWKADIIVFHQTGGDKLAPALNWYLNPNSQCSPNWVIDKNGDIYELVAPDNAAYCNGTRTTAGNLCYKNATSAIVRSRATNANYYTYSMEFVHCAKGDITEAQIAAAVELIKDVIFPNMRKNGTTPHADRQHFIGHCEINPVTRAFCPGKKFPYNEIIARVNGKEPTSTPTTAPPVYAVGDKVHIKNSAKTYAGTAIKIPAAYKGTAQTYTVMQTTASRVLLKELYSWVDTEDLEK